MAKQKKATINKNARGQLKEIMGDEFYTPPKPKPVKPKKTK